MARRNLRDSDDATDILSSIPELEEPASTNDARARGGPRSGRRGVIAIASRMAPTSEALLETNRRGDGDAMFDRATHAFRWTEHRRRAYRPEAFDVWLDHLSLEWTGWADIICNDESVEWIEEEIEVGASRERDVLAAIARDLGFSVDILPALTGGDSSQSLTDHVAASTRS